MIRTVLTVETVAELKAIPVSADAGAIYLLVGRAAVSDGLGGFYRWNPAASDTEDATFMRTFPSDNSAMGRWERVFQRVQVLPHGILVNNGGVKTFYAPGTTNASGEITLNLTLDNTANGTPIFTEIWFNDSKAAVTATTPANAVSSYVKNLSANLKQTTHGYFRANAVTITLGLLYAPFAAAPAGVGVQFKIEGV